MLVFNNEDDLMSTLTKVSNMTEDELEAYEELNGYKSLGKMAEEVFFSVDPDDFASEKEMQDFLNANKDYINLVADENGEFTAEPAFNQSEFKYLINEDQMFEINGTAYKVFEKGMVSAPKDQVNELMVLDSKKLQSISGNAKFAYTPFQIEEPLTKGDYENKGWAVSGRDRMHVKISTLSVPLQWVVNRSVKVKCEAHKCTWGVWWVAKRKISYSFTVRYRFSGYKKATSWHRSESGIFAREVIYKERWIDPVRLEFFDIWASSAQAGTARAYYDSGIRDKD